jgi:hypothetical protein
MSDDFLVSTSTKVGDIFDNTSSLNFNLLMMFGLFHIMYKIIFSAEQSIGDDKVFHLKGHYFMKNFTNIIMKIDMLSKEHNLISLFMQILYFTAISYWVSLKQILYYLDEKKCKVEAYSDIIGNSGLYIIAIPIVLSLIFNKAKLYSIAIFMMTYVCWLTLLVFTLAPYSYNIMLNLNQLFVWIPLFIYVTWYLESKMGFYKINSPEYTMILQDKIYFVALYFIKYLTLSTVIQNVFMPTFAKEVGYYCVNIKSPEVSESSYNSVSKFLKDGYL